MKYNTVTLTNGTTWMAEPLIYLPKGLTPSTDPTADSHVWYPYEITTEGATVATTDEKAIKELGYLYDLQAAFGGKEITDTNLTSFEGAQGICPKGWHIPTHLEYFNLVGKSTNDADGKVPENGDKALSMMQLMMVPKYHHLMTQDSTTNSPVFAWLQISQLLQVIKNGHI